MPEYPISPEFKDFDRQLVSDNVEKMQKDMELLIDGESWGGNAGVIDEKGESFAAAAANGYIDTETGELLVFTNSPQVSNPRICRVTFRVTNYFNPRNFLSLTKDQQLAKLNEIQNRGLKYKSRYFILSSHVEGLLSPRAETNLKISKEQYNAQFSRTII